MILVCLVDKNAIEQPTATLWYHDRALGITPLDVYTGGAGFWLIRTPNDIDSGLVGGVLPGPAPKVGGDPNGSVGAKNKIREIPTAIQPKSFNVDDRQFHPADRPLSLRVLVLARRLDKTLV